MKELMRDFFSEADKYDAICVTTNAVVKRDGDAVMGAGIALEFRNRFPDLPEKLGRLLREGENVPYLIKCGTTNIITFPTKRHWKNPSSIPLIRQSTEKLRELVDKHGFDSVLLSQPGCNNGGLRWEEVRPILAHELDDRFTVVISE